MFHFWMNTFFVGLDHEQHVLSSKAASDGPSRPPHSDSSTSSKPHSATTPTATAVLSSSSSVRPRRTRGAVDSSDRVGKGAVRTSSCHVTSTAPMPSALPVQRPRQSRDPSAAQFQCSRVTSDSDATANHLDGLRISQASISPRDNVQSVSTAGSSRRSRPAAGTSQEWKSGLRSTAPVYPASRPKTDPRDGKKNPIPSSQNGNSETGAGGTGSQRAVSRADSARQRCTGGDGGVTRAPDRNGMSHSSSTGSGRTGSQKVQKQHSVDDQNVRSGSRPSAVPSGTGMKKASSTVVISRPARTDPVAGRNARQPFSSTRAQMASGPTRYVQKDVATRRVLAASRSGAAQHVPLSRHASDRSVLSSSASENSGVWAHSDGIPSDPASPTGSTPPRLQQQTEPADPQTPRQASAADPQSPRQASAPSELQSSAVFEVSGSSCRPTTFFTLTLNKDELDKANKDTQHKVYSSDFKVTLYFTFPDKSSSGSGDTATQSSPVAAVNGPKHPYRVPEGLSLVTHV